MQKLVQYSWYMYGDAEEGRLSVRDSWHGDMAGYMYIGEKVATWERESSENVLPIGDGRVFDSVWLCCKINAGG